MKLLNLYSNSYVATPIIEVCHKHGLFELLSNNKFWNRQEIITKLNANTGCFTIALQALESLGWLESKNNAYCLNKNANESIVNFDLTTLYAIDPRQLIREVSYARLFCEKIEKVLLHSKDNDNQSVNFLEGAIIIPLIEALKEFDADNFSKEIKQLDTQLAQAIEKLFIHNQWLTVDKTELTIIGKQLLQTNEFGIPVSYKNMLSEMEDLLFGDYTNALSRIKVIDENLVNRQFNISAGDIKHEDYLKDLQQAIITIFNRLPLEKQPQSIINIGCGDGTLLKDVYQTIQNNTVRGQHLEQMPVEVIGVDYFQQVLAKASDTLALASIKHKTFLGDRNKPDEIFQVLEQNGLTTQQALHIRSFIDHRLIFDAKQSVNDTVKILASDQPTYYLDQKGQLLDATSVLSSWQHNLQTCAENINKSKLIALESHALPSPQMYQQLDGLGSWYNDFLHKLTQHYLISAEAFITLAASVGMFNQYPVKCYSGNTNYCRKSFHNLSKRDYIVRYAAKKDLKSLYQLEKLCWLEQLRTPQIKIRERLQKYPQGQFVLEKDGEVVGVIYSQRIAAAEEIEKCNMDNIQSLHNESGAIIQLIAVNIHPETQNLNYGDQLLEFMLQRCSLIAGITKIVAVTLCKKFDAKSKLSFEKYIGLQDSEQDPILAFHHNHGAKIVKPLANYRPRDLANQGNGVLVEYKDLRNRIRPLTQTVATENNCIDVDPILTLDGQQINLIVKEVVAFLLKVDINDIDSERPLMEMGLNSVDLSAFQRQIEEKIHQELQPGFFFEYNSCKKVIDYLTKNFTTSNEPSSSGNFNSNGAQQTEKGDIQPTLENNKKYNQKITDSDIAVIGMSCKLPGGIESPDKLWEVLTSEKCVISSYPKERGVWPTGVDKPGIDHGGFIDHADAFDALFFRISPKEAKMLDPQQRILLELAWACFEDAGINPSKIKGTKTGVFIGASNSDYSRLIQDAKLEVEAHNAIGSSLAVLANRISYYFDLNGPSLLIDTACSSSLVALHTAIQSLHTGECLEALVGGVNFICHPDLSIAYHKAGMLSPDAMCKVFDAKANGYVRSEGAVVFLLKPLRKAIEEKNQIHAVIKGSSINHGGLAAGLTVPNPQKQSELLVAAWKNAGISVQDISYIEAHGTGTSLGDPLEMQGIQSAYLQMESAKQEKTCGIGSIKSNLGHLESAAGITGLLKVILAMKNQELPATINFSELNPKIRFKDTPFYIQDKLQSWETKQLYLAGVSSFGSGGANAHVVVQEYKTSDTNSISEESYPFVLSANNLERLHEYAVNVIDWIEESANKKNFSDAIFSWQTGRTAMKCRLAIKVKDWKDLQNKLSIWLADQSDAETWSGSLKSNISNDQLWEGKPGQEVIEQALVERDIEQLGKLWISGYDIDWNKLYSGNSYLAKKPVSISLPTYPLARERYWINNEENDQQITAVEDQKNSTDTLFAAPEWQLSNTKLLSNADKPEYTQRYIFMCDRPEIQTSQIEALIPNSHCIAISSEQKDISGKYSDIALACFLEIKKILTQKLHGKILVQIVAAYNQEQTFFAGLTGLLKTAHLENPSLIGQVILIAPQVTKEKLVEQLQENNLQPQDNIIKYELSNRYIIRWQNIQPTVEKSEIALKDNGVYLLTGGLGGLGILLAKEILLQTTDARIIITGRSELTTEKQANLDKLPAKKGQLIYKQLDLIQEDRVIQLISHIKREYKHLNGIIHCAGMIKDSFILNKTSEDFTNVLKPKVTGTINIDLASKDIELDFLVMFSSFVSVIGNLGQADYASANGFMDQFSAYRNQLVAKKLRYGKTLSINWPLWQDGGMGVDRTSEEFLLKTIGLVPMKTSTGMQIFHRGLSLQYSQVFAMEGVMSTMKDLLIDEKPASSIGTNKLEIDRLDSHLLFEKTLQKVKQVLSKVIKLSVSKIDENEPLSSYGIDSIFINLLNTELARIFGNISKTLFFEYKTLADLTTYLTEEYTKECLLWTGLNQKQLSQQNIDNIERSSYDDKSVTAQANSSNLRNDTNAKQQQIAIIGISGIYPQAANLDEYWENFKTGRNCISEIPSDRWAMENFYDPDKKSATEKGKSYCKWGGFVDQFAQFDPLFFGISPREAMNIDPQERLFLQSSLQALEDSGYTRNDLKNKYKQKVGVFAGITKTGYDLYGSQFTNGGEKFHPRTSFGSIANRVSFFLDITAPSITVDTMCSSSLTAVHEACEHINRGECELAFAGGVNLYLHPSTYVWLSAQHMLSKDGLCRSFGAGANGFVPGEGSGVVLLKPLDKAIQDNDTIHGVILGSHANHGGKTNGYYVPNPKAQTELIRHAIDKAGINARDISYIEAHGTGTELGDPIEITGLQQAFAKDTKDTGYCRIGSTKSNIGHLEAAAGIAGLTKILLQMKHGQIAPSLHSEVLNPNIDFPKTPFIVNQALTTWDTPVINGEQKPRIAGISSIGAGGVNVHVLVQEYIPPKETKQPVDRVELNTEVIIPLSARTEKQLKQRAQHLLNYIHTAQPNTIDLHSMAYTLQVGREAMNERLGFIVQSVDSLVDKLQAFIAGEQDIEDVFQGQLKRNKDTMSLFNTDLDFQQMIDKWIIQEKLSKLLDLWVKGIDLDWNKFYGETKPKRISLPTYPFAKERYWIDSLDAVESNLYSATAILHPLLHTNTSDFYQQSYGTTFNGEEFFINDHKIHGQKVLPAFAYLEMARAAVVQAMPDYEESAIVELFNLEWASPIVADSKRINIALSADDSEQISYEIFSREVEEEIVHCQGQAVFSSKTACDKLAIEQLKGQMGNDKLDAPLIYSAFNKMGTNYGKSMQGLDNIYLGNNQLLAEIKLTSVPDSNNYFLHPGIMDSAHQACVALMADLNNPPSQPLLPTNLESIAILSSCTSEMYAWVRYSEGIQSEDEPNKLDIDLCDRKGNVCVKMKGLELAYFTQSLVVATLNETTNETFEKSWNKKSYLYKWEEFEGESPKNLATHNNVLIVCSGSSYEFENTILDYYNQNKNCQKTLIRLSDKTKLESKNVWSCGIHDLEGFQTCLEKIEGIDALYFLSMTEQQSDSVSLEELIESQESNEIQLLRLVKYLKERNKINERVDTYILTCDNYSLNDHSNQPLGAGVTGFAYSLAQGNYQFWVRNLDLFLRDLEKKQEHKNLFASILRESPTNRGEIIKIQSGKRYRQTFYKLICKKTNTSSIQHNGVYLIVGGSGTVGQVFTRNLIKKYSATVIWIGRSAKDSEKIQKTIKSFEEFGQNLNYFQADVTDLNSMQHAMELIKKKYDKISGAIFSGMVFDFENSIVKTTEADFRSIVDIKTKGSWVFYKVLENEPLDFMCYFSSGQAYSFSGASKLSGYATAITSGDSLIHSFQKLAKFPIGIINWGYWKSSVKKINETEGGIQTGNFDALEDQEGFECFEQFVNEIHQNRLHQVLCLNVSPEVGSLMHCNQEEFIALTNDGTVRLEKAIKNDKQSNQSLSVAAEKSNDQIKKSVNVIKPSQNIREYIWDNILNCLSGVLNISSEEIDPNIAFSDYGVDSILGVRFIDQVNACLSISLNTAIIFEYASIKRLSEHIMKVYREQVEAQMNEQADSSVNLNEEPQVVHEDVIPKRIGVLPQRRLIGRNESFNKQAFSKTRDNVSEIAVVGMSGKFPKAENINEFWENLIKEIDGIEELPANYLDQANYFSTKKEQGKTRCKWGGVLAERDCFDPLFFNISPKEAESMNPHQRLVLQESWKALEDAGYNPKDLSGYQTGVFIGAEPTGYLGDGFTGYSDAIIASRLSYIVDLHGPAVVVNTACSSSAVALHQACESLRNKESDIALAGGVHACMGQYVQILLDQIEMLSPSGRCFTFDDAGDGTILSEGVGMVVLKRLEDAIDSGDSIYGVISGSGINQDGASNGITAPNGAAQEELITSVYNKFKINPENISYVEAHGTATKLGDPIEANALVRTFQKFTDKKEFCSIGSVKSYIGHTSAAAGVIGLIRIMLSMQHKQIPKLLHFKNLNPLIEFKNSPFYIDTKLSEWNSPENTPRMAALNSFGHSGTNAHIVIKEYIPTTRDKQINTTSTISGAAIIPLSAKTSEQLRQKVLDLLTFISNTNEQTIKTHRKIDLESLAYTLQTGREAMEERLGFVVNSIPQLVEKLQTYLNGLQNIDNFYQGYAKRNKNIQSLMKDEFQESIDELIIGKKLSDLLKLWVKGIEFDWKKLYGNNKPKRINLPTYPFAKEKYWFENAILPNRIFAEVKSTGIHQLLHENTSNLTQQKYNSTFTGSEFFLKDHQVNGQKILPGVAYLEMARAAVENAIPFKDESSIIELHNLVWAQPIKVDKNKTVSIALFANDEDKEGIKQIDFEIYSSEATEKVVHSQGQANINTNSTPAKIDLAILKEQMKQHKFEKSGIYQIFANMGIDFGPSHQSIDEIHLGQDQLLAQISLPAEIEHTFDDYVLHPSIMDGALQSCNGLIVDLSKNPNQLVLPYALKMLRIVSPCVKDMMAWVRFSQGSKLGDNIIKLDIDICDLEGNICIQILEFSSRVLESKIGDISNEKADGLEQNSVYNDTFYSKVIEQILNKEISVEDAVELE